LVIAFIFIKKKIEIIYNTLYIQMPKSAKIVNIYQIFRNPPNDLKENTIKMYVERIRKVCEKILGKQYPKSHPYPSLKEANSIFKDFTNVFATLELMYPIENVEDDNEKKGNVENQKAYLTAIKTLIRNNDLKDVDEDMIKQYTDKLTQVANTSIEHRAQSKPTRNMEQYDKVFWNDIITKRNEYITSKTKTFYILHTLLPIAFFTYLPPRRLEYRLLRVFNKTPPKNEDGINYLLITRAGIEMSLDVFKNRTRFNRKEKKRTEVLPRYKVMLPNALAELVKAYISKKKDFREGDYLITKVKGDKAGEPYDDSQFSTFLKKCCSVVLKMNVSADDLRHYYTSSIDWASKTEQERKELAISMGDLHVSTNMSYIVPKANPRQQEVEIEGDIQSVEDAPVVEQHATPQRDIGLILDDMFASMKPYLIELFEKVR
jgi:integrase